jgi:hypothetical protein
MHPLTRRADNKKMRPPCGEKAVSWLDKGRLGEECPYHLGYVSRFTDRMYPTGNLFKCTLLFPQATFDKTTLFGSQVRPQNPLVSSNVLPANEMLDRLALQHH